MNQQQTGGACARNEGDLQEFTLPAGCVLHSDGVPFYLASAARIRCHPANWPYIRIGRTRDDCGRSIRFNEETGRFFVPASGEIFDPDTGALYREDISMDCASNECSQSGQISRPCQAMSGSDGVQTSSSSLPSNAGSSSALS